MRQSSLRIGDLVEIPPVQTVVRLEQRRRDGAALVDSFVLTAEVTRHLDVLAEALGRDTGQGYFLRGDFGSGKSHFLAALATWAAGGPGAETLAAQHPGLAKLAAGGRRWLPVDLSLVAYRSTTSLEQIVLEAIEAALAEAGHAAVLTPLAAFNRRLRELIADPPIADRLAALAGVPAADLDAWIDRAPRDACAVGMRLMQALGMAEPTQLVDERRQSFVTAMATIRQHGFAGLLLLIDELSEFFRSKPDARRLNEDARTLQFLGEFSAGQPLWIIAAVQEGLERTGDIAQATFRKIKDRFPIHLSLSTLHIRDLIARRLVRRRPGAEAAILRLHDDFRRQFPSFQDNFEAFRDCYPVHPLTLTLLEGLGDLFSEHRGIVDFVHYRLAGDPRRNIPAILDRPSLELLAPDSIYEHFADRLAEFSDFNVFPRQVVPHLDELIGRVLDSEADRELARRLVRILVLYRIHPTAEPPTTARLAELVACALAPMQPELNAQFVAEALLAPIAAASRFLACRKDSSTPTSEWVFEILAEEDRDKTFEARLAQEAGELAADDSRPLLAILAELPESLAWPGRAVLNTGLVRACPWRHSQRELFLLFCVPGAEIETRERVLSAVTAGGADAALVFSLWKPPFACPPGQPVAVWRLSPPADGEGLLRRWYAARELLATLDPSHPAEAPLLAAAREAEGSLRPAAERVALATLFAASCDGLRFAPDPAVVQMKRFDRILEQIGEALFERRYPRFAEIAPRGLAPSPRLYQRLLEELAAPGHLSLQEARRLGLTAPIESLAAPLGLVEVRSGAYVVAPDPAVHPLLGKLMELLQPAGVTPLRDIVDGLRRGPFGVPEGTTAFLLACLACRGTLTLVAKGRSLPLDFIRIVTLDTVDGIAPGELLGANERDTLLRECAFLAPPEGWEAFGLKQQSEAWQAALRFKRTAEKLVSGLLPRLKELATFSAFAGFAPEQAATRLEKLRTLADEVKVSYAARDGLQRFLAAWRQSELSAADLDWLRRFARFVDQRSEQFLALAHFLRHPAVCRAIAEEASLAPLHERAVDLLDQPTALLDDEDAASQPFETFRHAYAELYIRRHEAFYAAVKPTLDRHARRALETLRRLAAVEALDRPVGLAEALDRLDRPPRSCRHNVAEQLRRAPACDCGFEIGEHPDQPDNLAAELNRCLADYARLLRTPQILAALRARAYALEDAAPDNSQALRRLLDHLEGEPGGAASTLLDAVDSVAAQELARALAGTVRLERRQLGELTTRLRGRRLRKEQVRELVDAWLGQVGTDALLSLEDAADAPPTASGQPETSLDWWPALHPELAGIGDADAPAELAASLERRHPARTLRKSFARHADQALANFVASEPFHTQAVREAWLELAGRTLAGRGRPFPPSGPCRHAEAGTAAAVDARLAHLRHLLDCWASPFPDHLRARLPLAAIAGDAWSDEPLRQLAATAVARLEKQADDWLAALPPLSPISLDQPITVLVFDGTAPDVWLAAAAELPAAEWAAASRQWLRLEAAATTVAGIAAQFGLAGDPAAALPAADVDYCHLSGREAHPLVDLLPPATGRRPTVVRIALLDAEAHGGRLGLADLPKLLADYLRRELSPLRTATRQGGRHLLLTTDHGLGWQHGKLTHGAGGPFEQGIFRVAFPAD